MKVVVHCTINESFREYVLYISRVKVSPAEKIKFMVQIQNTAGYHRKKSKGKNKNNIRLSFVPCSLLWEKEVKINKKKGSANFTF